MKTLSFVKNSSFFKHIKVLYLLACVADGISRASAFVLVEKP